MQHALPVILRCHQTVCFKFSPFFPGRAAPNSPYEGGSALFLCSPPPHHSCLWHSTNASAAGFNITNILATPMKCECFQRHIKSGKKTHIGVLKSTHKSKPGKITHIGVLKSTHKSKPGKRTHIGVLKSTHKYKPCLMNIGIQKTPNTINPFPNKPWFLRVLFILAEYWTKNLTFLHNDGLKQTLEL